MITAWFAAAAVAADEPNLDALIERFQSDPLSLGAVVQVVAQVTPEPDANQHNGFTLATARLRVYGRLDHGFRYSVTADLTRSPALLDAPVGWDHPSGRFSVTAGRFKVPFSAEFLTPAAGIDFIDRSRVVADLAPGRDIGAVLHGGVAALQWSLGAFNGSRVGPMSNGDDRLLYAARVGARATLGHQGRTLALFVNGAHGDDTAASFAGDDAYDGTRAWAGADARFEWDDLLVSAEIIGIRAKPRDGPAFHPFGGYLTVGYRFAGPTQLLVRWDAYSPGDAAQLDHEIWFGVNWWPTTPFELQWNLIAPVEGGFADLRGLMNFQVAF